MSLWKVRDAAEERHGSTEARQAEASSVAKGSSLVQLLWPGVLEVIAALSTIPTGDVGETSTYAPWGKMWVAGLKYETVTNVKCDAENAALEIIIR
jgi:hypothetical protein